jgi:hypothetical protein
MKTRISSVAIILALLGTFVVAPLAGRAQELTIDPIPVSATKNNGNKNFNGEFTVTQFVEQGGGIFAEGILAGEVSNKHGKVTKIVEETVLVPVSVGSTPASGEQAVAEPVNAKRFAAQLSCDVLFLQLGPITLNLLGLNLYIGGPDNTPLIIDLTAVPSEGLLGQLLCALAGGLPLPGTLAELVALLNILFGLLG